MRMTMACATFMKLSKEAKISGFFAAMPVAEMPMKMENTTTAMVDVLRAPVMSRKGLVGTKLTSSLGSDRAFAVSSEPCNCTPRATSAALEVSPTAVKPNSLAIKMPSAAAIVVVMSRVPMVSALILPRELASLSFRMAEMMETMISGMMIICSSLT